MICPRRKVGWYGKRVANAGAAKLLETTLTACSGRTGVAVGTIRQYSTLNCVVASRAFLPLAARARTPTATAFSFRCRRHEQRFAPRRRTRFQRLRAAR